MTDFQTGTPGTRNADGQFTVGLLQATLTARKVASIVALAWDGPQLRAFTVSLGLGEQPERVEQLAGALALAAGAESCRVARDAGRLLLEIPKPAAERKPLRAGRLDSLTPATPAAVCVGIATGGRPVWVDLADERNAHIVMGGTTGSGKSVLLRWLLYRLAVQNDPSMLRMVLIDPKSFELGDFGRLPHLLHPVTSNPVDVARLLAWVAGELDRRAQLPRGATGPRLLVVVEEVADLLATQRDVGPTLARIAQLGRALGVHLLATTQQPGARSLGDALVNFPCRILGRVASATLTYGAAGRRQTGADVLLGRGDFLLLAAGETTRFQAPLMDGRQLANLPRAATVATLADELPTVVSIADLARDPRGGRGRRDLSPDDYDRLQAAIADGANADDVRAAFGIGYERAARMVEGYREVNR
jgi:S-DNA-T family DNA segregation ATPase FtsK/SpoIIIE